MVTAEVETFLRAHTRTFLVTVRPDGAPACHPMVALWRDGALYLNTYRKSAKARNVARDGRVACVVVTDDDDPEPRAIVLRGRAELVETGDVPAGGAGVRAPAGVGSDVTRRVQARVAEGKRVVLRVVPEEARMLGSG